jgi:hypothetical protein
MRHIAARLVGAVADVAQREARVRDMGVLIVECATGEASMQAHSRRWTAGLALAALVAAGAPVRAEVRDEYVVKSEIIERFTRFIDWPQGAFGGNEGRFVVCIAGDTRLSPYLERMSRERRIKERRIELRHLKPLQDPAGCHLLVIGAGERPHLKQILSRLSGRGVLTIADTEGFAREGVLINLFLDDEGHVGFEISASELKRSGLKVSAQLLGLARMVAEGGQ